MVDMQQTPYLTPTMLKQFCAAYQMELIDENYATKLIQVILCSMITEFCTITYSLGEFSF